MLKRAALAVTTIVIFLGGTLAFAGVNMHEKQGDRVSLIV